MSVLHPIDSVACIGERILSGVGDVVTSAFDSVFGGIVDWLTALVTDAVAAAASALGTFWVDIDTPVVGDVGNTPTSTIGFMMDHLGWYTAALAVLSVLVGAGRMALQRKAQAGVDTARSVAQFAIVSGAGVAVTALLTEAADQFSVWIIGQSGGGDFGSNLTALLAFSTMTGGLVIVLVLGLVAILASLIQVILMVMRIAMIYLLIATMPTAAAATNTELGRQWFKKLVAWLIAFILYKPVASIIYALAFRLIGDTSVFAAGGLMSVLVGVALMLMALLGLPALMRFLVPAVSSVASGAGAGAIAAGALATGATLAAGRAGGGFGGGGGSASGGLGGAAAGPGGAGQAGPSSVTSPGSGGGAATGGSLMASASDTSAAPPPTGGGGRSGGGPRSGGLGGGGSGGTSGSSGGASWSPLEEASPDVAATARTTATTPTEPPDVHRTNRTRTDPKNGCISMTASTSEPRTYGNWRRPTSPGIAGFGLLGTAVLMDGLLLLVIALMLFGFAAAGGVAVATLLMLGLLSQRDKHGRNAGQRIITRLGWARARRRGANLYRSGPLGTVPWGRYQLPGLASRSELSEWRDSYGRPFALIRFPQTNHYTVVVAAQPDGASLVDEDQVDRWVAGWGKWLSHLSEETDVVAASVTIDTAPDTGARLRLEVEGNLSPEGHPAAHAMLREAARTYPAGSVGIRAWIAVTVKGTTPSGKRRPIGDVARDLGSRLPGITGALADTGAGAAHLVDAYEMCQLVRTAYDPAVEATFDEAHAAGERVELDWTSVGPVAQEASWSALRHDSCWSVSWTMTQPPRGLALSSCLASLVGTHSDVDRKRVTLLYRPIPAGTAAAIVEADKRNAEFGVNGQARVTARSSTDLKAASATATEEARGSGLVNFGLVVTATVTELDRLDDAKAALINLSAGARILLRPAYGSQDSAFAASLPLAWSYPPI